jgi:hypothetical protein
LRVVILSTATTYTGGAIITLLNVLPLLQKKGVEPYFILKGHGSLENILFEKGIPYSVIHSYDWCVPEQKTMGMKNFIAWKIKSVINNIAEVRTFVLLKRIKADIYHLNCIYNGTGVRASKLLNIPVVWHLREFVDLKGETPIFWNSIKTWEKINKSDKIICVSGYLETAYKDKITDQSKLAIVYDGIDMSKFEATANKNTISKDIIVGLSGTAPIKNHKDAILALKKVKDSGINIILKIAGRWSLDAYNQNYKEQLKDLIVKNELKDCVEFVGMQNDMNIFWKSCDISVVCSIRESFGLAATESMACGVPLICSSTSISGELTENGNNVFVYKTGDSDQLADCLKKCISLMGTSELKCKTRHAETYVRNSFSIEKTAEALIKIYEEIR